MISCHSEARFDLGRRTAGLLATFAAAAALAACPTRPPAVAPQLSLLSTDQEIDLGRQGDLEILAAVGEYPDAALRAYVSRVGLRLAAVSERPDLPWTFKVLDDPSADAFALPGGFVYLTRGCLAYLSSEAEMAAVLGHEIGHVIGRHGVEPLSRAEMAEVASAASRLLTAGPAGPAGDAQASQPGLGRLFLKFSQDDERQADDFGYRYLERTGYDSRAMVTAFQVLEQVSGGPPAGRLPDWSTIHPDPTDRLAIVQAEIAAAPPDLRGTTMERAAYLGRIDGLVFGEDPRRGFFEGETFFDPRLAVQIRFPPGWATSHLAGTVGAVSPRQDAAVTLSPAPGGSPAEAARRFFAQEGVDPGSARRDSIGGLPGEASAFRSERGQSAPVAGLVAFTTAGERVFQLLGYSLADRYPRYQAEISASLASFGRLTDPRYLGVQPGRIALVEVPRALTLDELQAAHPSTVPLATLALLNHLDPGATLPAGTAAKTVVGGHLP